MNSNEMKDKFREIYFKYITREGSRELFEYLESTDFFQAPASTRFHGSYEGGLCAHSIKVFHEFARILKTYQDVIPGISNESVAICSLLHDICKANCYKVSTRNVKNELTGQWEKVPYYEFDEQFKFGGHGSKSVYQIMQYMKLTDEEAVAINCHMGAFDNDKVGDSYTKYPFAWALHVADECATYVLGC